MPAAAWAVQDPKSSWFSIGEHHSLRSTDDSACACKGAEAFLLRPGKFKLPVKGRYLTAGRGVVAQVGLRGEPAGAHLVRHTGDPYLPVEYPVLHNPGFLSPVRTTSLRVSLRVL